MFTSNHNMVVDVRQADMSIWERADPPRFHSHRMVHTEEFTQNGTINKRNTFNELQVYE